MVAARERSGARADGVAKIPVVSIDAGNGYFKMVAPDGRQISFVAAVRRLSDIEVDDVRPDAGSVLVTLEGEVYAFGQLARDMGGKSLFEAGKIEHTPLAVAAALALSGVRDGAVKVRLLVPDASKLEWKAAASDLGKAVAEFHAQVLGQSFARYQPRVEVELVSEGYPVWSWAHETAQIPQALIDHPLTGVIDAGTGDLTCSVWTKGGSLVRTVGGTDQVSFVAPAMKGLAGKISAGFAHRVKGHTPDRSAILDIIRAQGAKPKDERRYVYEQAGEAYDFTGIVEATVKDWNRELLHQLLQDNWQSVWRQLGMVFIVGGASDLLSPLEDATKGRFQVVRLAGVEPQLVNAALMAQMG